MRDAGELREETLLLVPIQRVRLATFLPVLHLNQGRGHEPRQVVLAAPTTRRKVQDAPDDGRFAVHRACLDSLRFPFLDEWHQGIHMDALEWQFADEPIPTARVPCVSFKAALNALVQVLGRRLSEGPLRAHAKFGPVGRRIVFVQPDCCKNPSSAAAS